MSKLDRIGSIAGGTIVVIFTIIMYLLSMTQVQGATTQEDLDKASAFAQARGTYLILLRDIPVRHKNDCNGAYYYHYNMINVECGPGTSMDRFLAVFLHELGHSVQSIPTTLESPQQRYDTEVDAWARGEVIAKHIGVWTTIDKLDFTIVKEIGLASYRRNIPKDLNFLQHVWSKDINKEE